MKKREEDRIRKGLEYVNDSKELCRKVISPSSTIKNGRGEIISKTSQTHFFVWDKLFKMWVLSTWSTNTITLG